MRRASVKQDKPAKSFDDLADIIRYGGGSVRLDSGEVVTSVSALRKAMGKAAEKGEDEEPEEDGEQDVIAAEEDNTDGRGYTRDALLSIAKESGITVPRGAKKADIVALLDKVTAPSTNPQ